MQVTKGTWRMREHCVPGALSSSHAREPGNEARAAWDPITYSFSALLGVLSPLCAQAPVTVFWQEPKPMNRDRGLLPPVYDTLIRTHPPPDILLPCLASLFIVIVFFLSFPPGNCAPFSAHFWLFLCFIPAVPLLVFIATDAWGLV